MKFRSKLLVFVALGVLVERAVLVRAENAAPAATQTPRPVEPQATAPDQPRFSYGGDASELGAQWMDDLVFLSSRVNVSEPSLFELDTTAANSSLAPDRAAEIYRTNVRPVILNLPALDVPLPSLPAVAKADFGLTVGQPYQGTLGRDFLANLVLEVDYARDTVRAYARASYKYSGKGVVFPLSQGNGMPVINIRFALEKGKEINGNFVVDTALDASVVLDNKFLAAHKMMGDRGKTMPSIDPFTGQPGATTGHIRAFQIEKRFVDDVLAIFSDQPFPSAGVPVAGAIGSKMLRRFNVTFDYPHGQLVLEPNTNFPDPDQEDKSGLMIVAKGSNFKTFEVVGVEPQTPAADAGIKNGDVIAGIDTDPAADLTILTARNLFRQVGHKYKVTLERGGETKEVTLQMRRYF
jgi:PDZ domain-containing protein